MGVAKLQLLKTSCKFEKQTKSNQTQIKTINIDPGNPNHSNNNDYDKLSKKGLSPRPQGLARALPDGDLRGEVPLPHNRLRAPGGGRAPVEDAHALEWRRAPGSVTTAD